MEETLIRTQKIPYSGVNLEKEAYFNQGVTVRGHCVAKNISTKQLLQSRCGIL